MKLTQEISRGEPEDNCMEGSLVEWQKWGRRVILRWRDSDGTFMETMVFMFGVDLVLSLSISALVFIKRTCQFHFLADQVDLATVGCGFG